MDTVYVVVGLTDYESSTVMAAFTSTAAAEAYLAEYVGNDGDRYGRDYHAVYDNYEVIPVTLGERPLRFGDLAQQRYYAKPR